MVADGGSMVVFIHTYLGPTVGPTVYHTSTTPGDWS